MEFDLDHLFSAINAYLTKKRNKSAQSNNIHRLPIVNKRKELGYLF
jgi:hypothetical protein